MLIGLNHAEMASLENLLVCTGIMGLLRKYSFSVSLLFSQAHLCSGNECSYTAKVFNENICIHACALILQQLTKV